MVQLEWSLQTKHFGIVVQSSAVFTTLLSYPSVFFPRRLTLWLTCGDGLMNLGDDQDEATLFLGSDRQNDEVRG